MGSFIHNAWYVFARSEEITRTPMARKVLGQRLVSYRTSSGAPTILRDRCPHRFAPLSKGTVTGDTIACPYHGIEFQADGTCSKIPCQDKIPVAAQVDHFPCLEKYGHVFVWMGQGAPVDDTRMLNIPEYGSPQWQATGSYLLFAADWRNILDNLIDPAHTSYVHPNTIGNKAGNDIKVQARMIDEHTVECGRWINNAEPVPAVKKYANIEGLADRWQLYYVQAPSFAWVDFGSIPAGQAHSAESMQNAPYRVLSYSFITPETETTSHYFSLQLRNFALGNAQVDAEFDEVYEITFVEDQVLLEAIQLEENDHPGLKPMRIGSDIGLTKLRHILQKMQAME